MRKIISLLFWGFFICQFACPVKIPWGLYGASAQNDIADPNEWDFGQAKQGQVLKHDFLFKNETKGVLNITGVNTSCGCTVSQSDKKSLKPGESAAIKVSFNSRNYLGQVKQFIYVNTDNHDLAVVRFTIKAEIIK